MKQTTTTRNNNTNSTAGRMIKTGLTASVIISQWTWAATLLQSSNVAWQYGGTQT
jgi:Na+/proline symporter